MRVSTVEALLQEDQRHAAAREALLEDVGRRPKTSSTPQQRYLNLVRGIHRASTSFAGHIPGWSNFYPVHVGSRASELSVRFFVQSSPDTDEPGDVAAHWLVGSPHGLPANESQIRRGLPDVFEVEYLSAADLPAVQPEQAPTPQQIAQDAGAAALHNLALLEQTLQAARGYNG